ncbi:hypothetical protein ACFFK0_26155 [Paenibacillus chartarius]|uniref:Uncharacterized protein n=1 Tax=Paenibacillus chartarius TaxID=747481 RepID=A0ABV6DTA3_9BACL
MNTARQPRHELLLFSEVPSFSGTWSILYSADAKRTICVYQHIQLMVEVETGDAFHQYLLLSEITDWIREYPESMTAQLLLELCGGDANQARQK